MANQFFDLRLGYLVQTPGLDTPLESIEFKAGDGEEIVLQFGRSPDNSSPSSVVTAPSWTEESLPANSTIHLGIKDEDDYYDGTLLAGSTTYTYDATEKTYTFELDLNTTAINTALGRDDSGTADVASIEDAQYEVSYKISPTAKPRTSKKPVSVLIRHDILSTVESSPVNAGDPSSYALTADTIQFLPSVNSLTGGTAAHLDSISTTSRSAGEAVAMFDDDNSSVFRIYELVTSGDAENSPDIIVPDDASGKVWKLRNPNGGGGIANIVEDTTPQLGGPLDTNSQPILESKGADVASANALTLGGDGNYYVVTGNTTISTIGTLGEGACVTLEFSGTPTLNHSSSLILPASSNIAAASGDIAVFREKTTGNWKCESYTKADGTSIVSTGGISNTVEDTTPQLGGPLDTNGKQIQYSKGADIASGTTLTIPTDGQYFNVTGTTTISGINTVKVGSLVCLEFDGIATLNYNATSFILPTSANITTAAGDVAQFVEISTGNWKCFSYQRLDGSGLSASGTGDIKADGTVAFTAKQEVLQVNYTDPTELVVTSASITPTQGFHTVRSFDSTAANLNNILGSPTEGDELFLRLSDESKPVILSHNTSIKTPTEKPIYMYSATEIIHLIYSNSFWNVIGPLRDTTLQANVAINSGTTKQSLTSTPVTATGSSVTISPRVRSSKIFYRYECTYWADNASNAVLVNFEIFLNGTEVTNAKINHFHNSANSGGRANFSFVIDTPSSGDATILVKAREYSTSQPVKLHEVSHWDGTTSNEVSDPVVEWREFIPI